MDNLICGRIVQRSVKTLFFTSMNIIVFYEVKDAAGNLQYWFW